jgi:asparagine synthase (glutamine-hydrolysing)
LPGIYGIISKQANENYNRHLKKMKGIMSYEDFYISDTFVNTDLNLYLGWTNRKGSYSDCMPLMNKSRSALLIFHGENFTEDDNLNNLILQNPSSNTQNANYLITLYEEYGAEFVNHLNGQFAGILVDFNRKESFLFTDRLGLNRIYYYQNDDAFWFSSEAKTILKLHPQTRQLNEKQLYSYFYYGTPLSYQSLFNDIKIIPGGSIWKFTERLNLKKNKYFNIEDWENQEIIDYNNFKNKFTELFYRKINHYKNFDQKMAMSLTGGLDSRLILTFIENYDQTMPCYTFGSKFRECFDIRTARKIAAHIKQPYQVLEIDEDFYSNFAELARDVVYFSDGMMDIPGSHDLYLNRIARSISDHRLTGKFGSEVIRRSSTLKRYSYEDGYLDPEFKDYLEVDLENEKNVVFKNPLSYTLMVDIPFNEFGRITVEKSQLTYLAPFIDYEILEMLYQAPEEVFASKNFIMDLIKTVNPNILSIRTDLGYGGDSNRFYSQLIEKRHWFLFKLEWYINEGMPHWLSKLNYSLPFKNFEDIFLGYNKIDLYRKWMKENLATYVKSIVLDPMTLSRVYWNKKFIEKMVDDHIAGKGNYLNEIKRTITLELIHRTLLDN